MANNDHIHEWATFHNKGQNLPTFNQNHIVYTVAFNKHIFVNMFRFKIANNKKRWEGEGSYIFKGSAEKIILVDAACSCLAWTRSCVESLAVSVTAEEVSYLKFLCSHCLWVNYYVSALSTM